MASLSSWPVCALAQVCMAVLQLLAAGHHPKWSGEELSLRGAQHVREFELIVGLVQPPCQHIVGADGELGRLEGPQLQPCPAVGDLDDLAARLPQPDAVEPCVALCTSRHGFLFETNGAAGCGATRSRGG
jgi:hypothetical protein